MEYKRLGDIASYINGYAFKPSDRGIEGLPIIRIQDLTGNAYDTGYYNGSYPKEIEINDGDVLISWSASLGVYEWNRGKALLNQHIFKVVFDKAEVNKNYFIFAIRNSLRTMTEKTHGATMKHITKRDFEEVRIPFPSLGDQDKIADILSAVEKIIEQRNHQLQTLDTLIKARFVEMFGDPQKEVCRFPVKELKDTCTIITGNTPSRKVEEYYGNDIEWIKTDNIISRSIYPTEAEESLSEEGMTVGRSVDKGAILMACIAGSVASIGKVCITDRKVAFNQQINAIVPYEYDVRFLLVLFQLSKDYLVEDLSMALKGILSKSKLESKRFIVPPIDEQKQFAAFANHVDKSKAAVQKSLDQTQLLMDSLMQQYFG